MTVDWEKSNTRIIIICLLKERKEIIQMKRGKGMFEKENTVYAMRWQWEKGWGLMKEEVGRVEEI